MRKRILRHLRPRSAAYLATGVLVGAGGSYALAATSTKTITACADKGTGVLHLKARKRCKRGQTRVSWNQVGPPGPQGRQGPPGTPAVSIWGSEAANSNPLAQHGLSIQHVSTGIYQVTVIATGCAHAIDNAPVLTVLDGNPPVGHTAGVFPVAWTPGTVSNQFTVYRGVVVGGAFTLSDGGFNVYDTC
jgi:hypothetical protein